MHIAIEGNACVRMTEQLAESFGIESGFYANGCIGMSEQMKIYVSDTAYFQNSFKAILHGSGFSRLASSGDDVKIIAFSFCF